MVFEEKIENYKKVDYSSKQRIDLEPERLQEMEKIMTVYKNEVKSTFSLANLMKMAIDNLIVDIEKLPSEEEGIESCAKHSNCSKLSIFSFV